MKQDESQSCLKGSCQSCLKGSYVLGPTLWSLSREGGWSEEPKEIKSQIKTILETIHTLYSI